MKSSTLKFIVTTTVFAVLSISVQFAAQNEQSPSTSQSHYSVINLGTLGGSFGNGYGGVNNRGWVTGDSNLQGDQNEHAFLWRDGIMTDLGTLGGLNSSVPNPTKNNRSLIAGAAQTSTVDPLGEFWGISFVCTNVSCQGWQNLERAFLWQNGVMTALPTLGGNNSIAYGVNNLGQVVGLAENSTIDTSCTPPQKLDFEPVIWGPKAGQILQLPVFSGDSIGEAFAINDRSQVVGVSGPCGFPSYPIITIFRHAILWQNGVPTDLGSLGGMINNFPFAINNQGQIVGQSDLVGDTTTHAFLWQNGVMTDLGTLPGDVFSGANDINDIGQVVGISCDVNFNCRAFLWENGVMIDLNTLIPPDSPFQLIYGGGINDRGEIAGTAFDPSTLQAPAFLAIPVAGSSVAQPGSRSRPKGTLPENVRNLLQHRMHFGPFWVGR